VLKSDIWTGEIFRLLSMTPSAIEESQLLEMQIKLGERVRALRLERGWSQDTFAHLVGLNRAYPNKIEKGKIDVRFSTIVRMAKIFELPVDQLLQFD
jgi:DNA-binding XRE family transcriptional regulator